MKKLLFGGVAALTTVFRYHASIGTILKVLKNAPLQEVHIPEGKMSTAVLKYINTHFKDLPFTKQIYSGNIEYINTADERRLVGYTSHMSHLQVIKWTLRGNIPIPIFIGKNKSGAENESHDHKRTLSISFLRGTFNSEKFINDVIDYYNKTEHDRLNRKSSRYEIHKITGTAGIDLRGSKHLQDEPKSAGKLEETESSDYKDGRILNYDENELGYIKENNNPLRDLYFPKDIEKYIIEAQRWHVSQEWYKQRRIPWKRGWLLYGPPGTGKTSLVRALGKQLGIPIYYYDLSSLRDQELIDKWGSMVRNSTPCIALIEDIDGVFDGRKKISTASGSLTFDTLLNVLDGIESSDGVFLVITTNNLDKVDEAIGKPTNGGSMSTRPGRIDRCIKLEKLSEDGRYSMAKRILDEWPDEHEQIVNKGHNDSGAQFQERCSQLALDLFWEKNINR
ncbi:AAA family ATPase [Candidatus Pacearchaeota archaeon]|nr:AAA family ATPase [Candidatus Pacearchaeota archaeon]